MLGVCIATGRPETAGAALVFQAAKSPVHHHDAWRAPCPEDSKPQLLLVPCGCTSGMESVKPLDGWIDRDGGEVAFPGSNHDDGRDGER